MALTRSLWGIEGGEGGGEAVVASALDPSAGGDDELLVLFDDDAWCMAESLDQASVFVVGGWGKPAGSQVDIGSKAQIGAVHWL